MGTYFFTKDAADMSVAKVEAEKKTLLAEKTTATELKTSAEKALAIAHETTRDLKAQVIKLATLAKKDDVPKEKDSTTDPP